MPLCVSEHPPAALRTDDSRLRSAGDDCPGIDAGQKSPTQHERFDRRPRFQQELSDLQLPAQELLRMLGDEELVVLAPQEWRAGHGQDRAIRGIQNQSHRSIRIVLLASVGVDMNIVQTASGQLVEVQGTGEAGTFDRSQLSTMLDLGERGIAELIAIQQKVLGR